MIKEINFTWKHQDNVGELIESYVKDENNSDFLNMAKEENVIRLADFIYKNATIKIKDFKLDTDHI